MSDLLSYTVVGEFDDPVVALEWIAWLRDEHFAEVLAAGALDAEVVLLDSADIPPTRCEVRYHFRNREAFASYERNHAPGLRAKSGAKFPSERGVRLTRRTGIVSAQARSPQS